MAKSLNKPVPSSSLARLLDESAVTRAVSKRESLDGNVRSVERGPEPPLSARYVKREFVLTEELDTAVTELTGLVRRCTGARITHSHIARALFAAAAHCKPAMERELVETGKLKLPSNAKGNTGARERFEGILASAILAAMRVSPAFRDKSDRVAQSEAT